MRHLAVYLMLVLGGNASPTAEDVTNALSQCGIDVDEERLNTLVAELDGKDLAELVALGKDRLVSATAQAAVAVGGAVAGAAPAAAADAPAAKAPAPKVEEVDALEGGMDMFGGGGGGDY